MYHCQAIRDLYIPKASSFVGRRFFSNMLFVSFGLMKSVIYAHKIESNTNKYQRRRAFTIIIKEAGRKSVP